MESRAFVNLIGGLLLSGLSIPMFLEKTPADLERIIPR